MRLPASLRPSRILLTTAAAALLGATGCASGGPGFIPPSRPAEFSMAGIPWGISGDSVTLLIEPRGYNYNNTDEDGDLWFDGVLFRTPTRVFAFMGEQKLVKLRMIIITPDSAALTMYQTARAELIKQYGRPKETIEEYAAPYRKGDRKELAAIREGMADIRTYWLVGSGTRQQHVVVRVTDKLTVAVDYDGPTWDRESVRRRRAAGE